MPNGLNRLVKARYIDPEIFGYRENTSKFGNYNPKNTMFIASKDYRKMMGDASLKISSSHLIPSLHEHAGENMPKFDGFWKEVTNIHAELGVNCMVQSSLPRIEDEDNAKVISEIFNRVREIARKAGIL